MGRLEESRLGLARIGEGATLEAEQLGLQQRLGNGFAVDHDKRSAGAGAAVMNAAGEQTLAGPGLAKDQDGRKST